MSGEGYQKPQVFGLSYFFFIICFWFIVGRFLHHGPLAEGKLEVRVYLWIRD